MKRTCVLTSRENFVWASMQEIIPAIAKCWRASAQGGAHEVEVLDIDETPLTALMPSLIRADNIVLTCFTFKMARLSRMIRERFSLDARFFVYLHNQATIGCWPWHVWGAGPFFREDDVFLSSCRRDAEALKLCFEDPRVEISPFTFAEDFNPSAGAPSDTLDFVFVGRLSPQKNLHGLLQAYRLFLDRNPGFSGRLVFFGQDDGIGSPNMGMKSEGYAESLRELSRALDLVGRVVWRGHVDRETLDDELPRRYVFVSPSLHSDENFGMAAFRALCSGQIAILSDWGGHADFPEAFGDQALLVPVLAGPHGPEISADDLFERMNVAIASPERFCAPTLPTKYRVGTIAADLGKWAAQPRNVPSAPLRPSLLARKILESRERYAKEDPMRIFESYRDPLALPFFQSYGMRERADSRAP